MELRGEIMTSRSLIPVFAAALRLLAPADVRAQEVVIAHDEIKCIVAGKFPKFDACFTPVSQVGKARVYFRPETVSSWFYVDMTAAEACHAGVLPKPNKKLVDKKIFYYVDAQGAGTARTQEYAPVVVEREEDCKELPPAPVAATGPPAVYPSLPAGFGGAGVSGAVIAAGVAGIVATGGGAVLPGDDTPTSAPPTVPVVTVPPSTTLPTPGSSPTPPTITPLVVACEAAPRSGEAPLRVQFATFPTGGTGTYEYLWSFGDGNISTNPNPANVFLNDGVYDATVRVTSGDQVALCTRQITVALLPEPNPSPTPTPTPEPPRLKVEMVGTGGRVTGQGIDCPGDCEEVFPIGSAVVVTLTATHSNNPPGAFTEWTGHCSGDAPSCTLTVDVNRNVVAHFDRAWTLSVDAGSNSSAPGSLTSSPSGISCTWPPACTATASYLDNTTVTLTVATTGTVRWGGACAAATSTVCTVLMTSNQSVTVDTLGVVLSGAAPGADRRRAITPVHFTSQLEVPEGEGHVLTNGTLSSPVQAGRSSIGFEKRAGTNRVEAVLVAATGRPGAWRFDFSGHSSFRPGSLRVLAGTVVSLTGDAIVFQLQGRPGERIAFAFDVTD
jgi:PKD repeat protein